jgi:hypothetical protein
VPAGSRQALLEAVTGHLAADLTIGALSMQVTTREGTWPSEFPIFVVLGESTSRFEVVRVDGIAGSTFTIVRAQLGTVASAHPATEAVVFNWNRADLARMLARLEQPIGSGGGTPSGTVTSETGYGQGSTPGVSALYSRGDHSHGSPSLTAATPAASAVGDTGAAGTGVLPAKDDHRHAREGFGSTPTTSAAGDAAAAGAATTLPRSDHRHGREGFGSPVASGVGDTGADGAAATLARSDHRHQREAFGAVVAETAYGQASGNGAASTVARGDHTHGSPPKHRQEITFSRTGALSAPIIGALRWYPGVAVTIIGVRASVGTAPVGGSVIADVNKNGATIFTTQSNRPTIAAGTFTDLADAINVPAVGAGEYLTADIDNVGPTSPGSDLTVTVLYTVD